MALEAGIAGLGRFAGAAFQVGAHVGGDFNAVLGDDGQRVGAGGRVGQRRAACDQGRVITGDIGNQQRLDACRGAVQREPAALERRQVLAHAVHLADAGAAAQQRLVDGLLVGQRQAGRWRGQQRRTAAGDQAQHQVVGSQALHQFHHALRGARTGFVGNGVRGFHHFNALAIGTMAVARHHQARQLALPVRLDRLRHRGSGLAGADHYRAALGRRGQVRRQAVAGADGSDRGIEQVAQQRARVGLSGMRCGALGREQGGLRFGGEHEKSWC